MTVKFTAQEVMTRVRSFFVHKGQDAELWHKLARQLDKEDLVEICRVVQKDWAFDEMTEPFQACQQQVSDKIDQYNGKPVNGAAMIWLGGTPVMPTLDEMAVSGIQVVVSRLTDLENAREFYAKCRGN